jgi:DNA polymerase-3 subunit beta
MRIVIKSGQLKDVISKFSGFVKHANNKYKNEVNDTNILIRCLDDRLVATLCQCDDFMFDVVLDCVEHDIDLSENRHLFLIPLKKISDLSKKMGCDNVVFEYTNFNLLVTLDSTNISYKIECCDGFFTMNMQDYTEAVFTKVSGVKLLDAMKSCSFAMAVNDSRTFLNGMLFRFEKDLLKLVATNAHRLSYNEVESENSVIADDIDCIVPYDTVKLLQKIIQDDDVISLSVNNKRNIDKAIIISCDNWIITAVCIDARFPDYNIIIPTQNNCIIRINAKELKRLIDKVSIIGFDTFNTINLRYNNDKKILVASVINESGDKINDLIDVVAISNNLQDISFNVDYRYLLDLAKNCPNEVVDFCFYDSQRSILFTIPDNTAYKHVIMPLT